MAIELTVSQARARLADALDNARTSHSAVYLTRRGKRVGVIADADQWDRLVEAAEDLADIEAARLARSELEQGAAAIPWDEGKSDLGLA